MDYVPVRTSTLRGDQETSFDLHIFLRDKYILYIRQGDHFEGARLDRLREKKLRKMYIPADQEENYRNYIEKNLDMAYSNSSEKSLDARANIVQGHQQSNAEEVMENPEDAEAYNNAKDGCSKYLDFLELNPDAMKTVLSIENSNKDLGHHGVTTATIAVAMASKLGITDKEELKILSLGCLLHDMGHLHHAVEYRRPLSELTADEMQVFKDHPKVGAEVTKDKQHFDQKVINIIMQHEEMLDGSGFPQRLTDKKIDRMALICGAANKYDRLVTFENMEAKDAIKKLMIDNVGRYPLEYLNALKAVLKEKSLI